MLLTTIIVILFYVGVYIYLNVAYPKPLKNTKAEREFNHLMKHMYAATTNEQLKDYESWFLEFILHYDLTKEEKEWYNNFFFSVYSKKLVVVK